MSNRTLCWGQTPSVLLMRSMSWRMSIPLMYTVPEVGGNRPVRTDLSNIRHIKKTILTQRAIYMKLQSHLSLTIYSNVILKFEAAQPQLCLQNHISVNEAPKILHVNYVCDPQSNFQLAALTWWWFCRLHCGPGKKWSAPHRTSGSGGLRPVSPPSCRFSPDFWCLRPESCYWVLVQCDLITGIKRQY